MGAKKLLMLFQVECHPYLNQSKLIAFCKEREIVVIAYAPFGRPGSKVNYIRHDVPSLLEDPKLQEIAAKRGKTVAQVILRYLVSGSNTSQCAVVVNKGKL
jgi:diketogulonate reductase-like aldo/keto reductase